MSFKRFTVQTVAFGLALVAGNALAQTVTVSDATPGTVDNNATAFANRTLTVGEAGTVDDVRITLDFWPQGGVDNDCTTSGAGDGHPDEVAFRLSSPAGTAVALIVNFTFDPQDTGPTYGNGNARVQVTLDDDAADKVGTGGLVSGTFRPEQLLSAFDGESASGDWVLGFQDDTVGDELCYRSASLEVTLSGIDLDDPQARDYAEENRVDADTGSVLANANEANLNVTNELGFGVNADSNIFVRYDLSNGAQFEGNPAFDVAGTDSGTLAQGGSGADFVVFEVTPSANYDQTQRVDLLGHDFRVFDRAGFGVTYSLHETATSASAGPDDGSPLAITSASPVVSFEPSVFANLAADPHAGTEQIDVTQEILFFTGGSGDTITPVGEVSILAPATQPLALAGTTVGLADVVDAATVLQVAGPLASIDRVFSSADDCGTVATFDVAVTDDNRDDGFVEFDIGNATIDEDVCVETDGATDIEEGTFSALYQPVPSDPALFEVADQDLGDMSVLDKNGTTARANFLLTPDGQFRNFVRITNPSSIQGRVFLTLINDAGDSVRFDLDNVTVNNGGTDEPLPAELAARSATPLISVDELFEAARLEDQSFEVVGGPKGNKLRLEADGEFGTPGTPSAIRLDVLSVSNDNQSFFQFGIDNFDGNKKIR